MKQLLVLFLLLLLAYLARRPLLRVYLSLRDQLTDAPPASWESWLFWRILDTL